MLSGRAGYSARLHQYSARCTNTAPAVDRILRQPGARIIAPRWRNNTPSWLIIPPPWRNIGALSEHFAPLFRHCGGIMRQNGALFVLTTLSLLTTYARTLPMYNKYV